MPDYSNPATRETNKSLGPFEYEEELDKLYAQDVIMRGPYELDNGAIYQGQWTKDGLRHGRGI